MVEKISHEIVKGDSIRVLMTRACQERCFFCHNEGSSDNLQLPMNIDKTMPFLEKARDSFGLNVIHLTGGEPTLHPQLTEVITRLKDKNFEVQMTTNGNFNPELLNRIIDSGLNSVNFSLHAITPIDFRKTQIPKEKDSNLDYFDSIIRKKKNNIERAKGKMRVKLNTVVVNQEITGKVFDFAIENEIPLRLMRNLNSIKESDEVIEKLLLRRDLVPIREQEAIGDSGGSGTVYGFDRSSLKSVDIKVKKFGDVYLKTICDECFLRNTSKCREKFYGIRLGVNPKTLNNEVRLCIDRDDPNVLINPDRIFKGSYYEALLNNYVNGKT